MSANLLDEVAEEASPKPNYESYIKSQAWRDKKDEWLQAADANVRFVRNHPDPLPFGSVSACWICGNAEVDFHHKTYDRLGNEELADLVPLCRTCHGNVHKIKKRYPQWDLVTCQYAATYFIEGLHAGRRENISIAEDVASSYEKGKRDGVAALAGKLTNALVDMALAEVA